MFAAGNILRTSDLHSLIDLRTGKQRNEPADVILEPHVWLGDGAIVSKGVVVGLGSVVAARAFVSKTVPRFTLVGGVPAKEISQDITWDRSASPKHDTVQRLQALALTTPVAKLTDSR